MPKIFINYRRGDTQSEARLLYESLIRRFPREDVIMDIDTISPTSDFKEYLDRAVAECDFLLAVIGPRWMETGDLHNEADWVRIEIEAALARDKRIMPIIVNDATMPRAAILPQSLQPFAYKNGLPLDSGRDFSLHIERIAHWIERLAAEAEPTRGTEAKRVTRARRSTEDRSHVEEGTDSARTPRTAFGVANQLYCIGDWRHYRDEYSWLYFWYGDGELALEIRGNLESWNLRKEESEFLIIEGEIYKQDEFQDRYWETTTLDRAVVVGRHAHYVAKGSGERAKDRVKISILTDVIRIADNTTEGDQIELPIYEAQIHVKNFRGEQFQYPEVV